MHEQLGLPEQETRPLQADVDAIVRLAVRALLTDVEKDRAVRRAIKRFERDHAADRAAARSA